MTNEHGMWTQDTNGNQVYLYQLDLTDGELESLRFMAARGYDCGLLAAGENLLATETGVRLTFREHSMWEVQAAYAGGSDAFTCASFGLRNKLYALIDAIV